MIRGRCWLMVDGHEEPVNGEAGDVFLLSVQRSFVLASDLAAVPIEAATVFSPNVSAVVDLGGGEDCLQIGGFVRLDPASGNLLADVLAIDPRARRFPAPYASALASRSAFPGAGWRATGSQSRIGAARAAYFHSNIACASGSIRRSRGRVAARARRQTHRARFTPHA